MNTLTQQQINQYQWQVTDGMARIVNPHNQFLDHPKDEKGIPFRNPLWREVNDISLNNTMQTNAPDGIYSGEAFEEPVWQYKPYGGKDYIVTDNPFLVDEMRRNGVAVNPFLRLKPSHLPAVLTSQPGKGWKDRYRCYIKQGNVEKECRTTNDTFLKNKSLVWRLKDVTPPAEQEAETVELNQALFNHMSQEHGLTLTQSEMAEIIHIVEQSTLPQKDQRITELKQMLDQCQKNDLYFEQEKEHLNKRISELERERNMYKTIVQSCLSAFEYVLENNDGVGVCLGYQADSIMESMVKKIKGLPTSPQH